VRRLNDQLRQQCCLLPVPGINEVGAGGYDDESCEKVNISAEFIFYKSIE